MELILQQMNSLRKGAKQKEYTKEELLKMDSYLNGKIPFSELEGFIVPSDSSGYDKKLAGEIAKAYKKDKSLAPVISRYCYLFNRVVIGSAPIKHFLDAKLSVEEIFLNDPDGATALVNRSLACLAYDQSYDDEVGDYPYFSYFDKVYEKYPSVLEEEALKEENCYFTTAQTLKNTPLLAFIHSKYPEKYGKYKEKIIADATLRLAYCYPEHNKLCAILQEAEKRLKGFELDKKDPQISNRHTRAEYAFYFALLFLDFPEELLTILLKYELEYKPRCYISIRNLYQLAYAVRSGKTYNFNSKESINSLIKSTATFLGKQGLPDNVVYEMAIIPNPSDRDSLSIPDWVTVDEVFAHNDTLISTYLEKLEKDSSSDTYVIAYVGWLWKQNRLTETLAHYEKFFLNAVHHNFCYYGENKSLEGLVSWLSTGKEKMPSVKLAEDVGYDYLKKSAGIFCFGLIHEKSEIARRFIQFLIECNSSLIDCVIANLETYWDKNMVEIFAYIESCFESKEANPKLKKLQKEYQDAINTCKQELGLEIEEVDFGEYTPHTFTPELLERMLSIQEKAAKIVTKKQSKYTLSPPLHPGRIGQFERENKFALPDDYAWILMNIGNGGDIPTDCNFALNYEEIVEGEFPLSFGQMYSMSAFEKAYKEYDDGQHAISIAAEKAAKGHIIIGFSDDNSEICLILKGKAAGTVWSIHFGTDSYGAFPMYSPYRKGEPMTFADWFEIWLDKRNVSYEKYIDFKQLKQVELTEQEMQRYKKENGIEEKEAVPAKKKATKESMKEAKATPETSGNIALNHTIGNAWDEVLKKEFEADYFKKLQEFLNEEYATKTIYPKREDIFNALKFTAPDKVRVVILGQDPYINEGQAHGFALSVLPGVTPPPSLKNMYKELEADLGIPVSKSGYLIKWAEQGVLLLNTVLTVEAGKSNAHAKKGWEKFTDAVFAYLGASNQPIVFMLWGKPAQAKEKFITGKSHCIIKSPHPSPLSASTGFFGSKPYSQANAFLKSQNLKEIDWRVE